MYVVYESPNRNMYSVAFQGIADATGMWNKIAAKERRQCNMLGDL